MSSRFSLRAFVCSVALVLTLLGGSQAAASVRTSGYDDGASGGGGASGSALIDETDRGIALSELSGGASVHHLTVNERSILLIESNSAPGGVLAGGSESQETVQVNRGQPF
jgi:hypothetical protein